MNRTKRLQNLILATCFLVMSFVATSQAENRRVFDRGFIDGEWMGCQLNDCNGAPYATTIVSPSGELLTANHGCNSWVDNWDPCSPEFVIPEVLLEGPGGAVGATFPYYDEEGNFCGCKDEDGNIWQANTKEDCWQWNWMNPRIGEAPDLEGTYVGEGQDEGRTDWYAESIGSLHNYFVATQFKRTPNEYNLGVIGIKKGGLISPSSDPSRNITSIYKSVRNYSYELWMPILTGKRFWDTVAADGLGAAAGAGLAGLVNAMVIPLSHSGLAPYVSSYATIVGGASASVNEWYSSGREGEDIPVFDNPEKWLYESLGNIHNMLLQRYHELGRGSDVTLFISTQLKDYGFDGVVVDKIARARDVRPSTTMYKLHKTIGESVKNHKDFDSFYANARSVMRYADDTKISNAYLAILSASHDYWEEFVNASGGKWDWSGYWSILGADAWGGAVGGATGVGLVGAAGAITGMSSGNVVWQTAWAVGVTIGATKESIGAGEDYYGE